MLTRCHVVSSPLSTCLGRARLECAASCRLSRFEARGSFLGLRGAGRAATFGHHATRRSPRVCSQGGRDSGGVQNPELLVGDGLCLVCFALYKQVGPTQRMHLGHAATPLACWPLAGLPTHHASIHPIVAAAMDVLHTDYRLDIPADVPGLACAVAIQPGPVFRVGRLCSHAGEWQNQRGVAAKPTPTAPRALLQSAHTPGCKCTRLDCWAAAKHELACTGAWLCKASSPSQEPQIRRETLHGMHGSSSQGLAPPL